jgi:hypothetical protein
MFHYQLSPYFTAYYVPSWRTPWTTFCLKKLPRSYLVKNSPPFMEHENSLPWSPDFNTGLYYGQYYPVHSTITRFMKSKLKLSLHPVVRLLNHQLSVYFATVVTLHAIFSCYFTASCHFIYCQLPLYFTTDVTYITDRCHIITSYHIAASSSWHFKIIIRWHLSTHLYLLLRYRQLSLYSTRIVTLLLLPAVMTLPIVTSFPGVKLRLTHASITTSCQFTSPLDVTLFCHHLSHH